MSSSPIVRSTRLFFLLPMPIITLHALFPLHMPPPFSLPYPILHIFFTVTSELVGKQEHSALTKPLPKSSGREEVWLCCFCSYYREWLIFLSTALRNVRRNRHFILMNLCLRVDTPEEGKSIKSSEK